MVIDLLSLIPSLFLSPIKYYIQCIQEIIYLYDNNYIIFVVSYLHKYYVIILVLEGIGEGRRREGNIKYTSKIWYNYIKFL